MIYYNIDFVLHSYIKKMKPLRVSFVDVGYKAKPRNSNILVFLFYTFLIYIYLSIFNMEYIITNI